MNKKSHAQASPKKRGRPHKRPARVEQSQTLHPVLCSVTQCCELMSLGRTKVKELIYGDQIKSVCVGRRRLIPYSELIRFSEQGA